MHVKATPMWDVYNSKHAMISRSESEFPFDPAEWELQAPSRVPACTARGAITAGDIASLEADVSSDAAPRNLLGRIFGGGSGSRNGAASAAASAAAPAPGAESDEGSSSAAPGAGVMSMARRAGKSVGSGFAGFLRRAGAAAAELIEGGAPPSGAAVSNMLSAQADLRTPFRAGDASHEEALEVLWRGLYPDKGACRRPDVLWIEAGCMGPDPADTFAAGGPTRAAGLLGLQTLVYCATKHGERLRDLVAYHSGEDETCLRVVGTVNALVVELAGKVGITADDMDSRREAYFRLFEDADGFSELVFLALAVLEKTWTELGGTQARFAEVLGVATEKAMAWLITGPASIDGLRAAAKEADAIVV
jgi:hypothetical protein